MGLRYYGPDHGWFKAQYVQYVYTVGCFLMFFKPISTCMYIMYIYIHTHVIMCVCQCVHVFVCLCAYIYIYLSLHVYLYMYTQTTTISGSHHFVS
jgi:hypothetical protein